MRVKSAHLRMLIDDNKFQKMITRSILFFELGV